jgi:hypothetical protein
MPSRSHPYLFLLDLQLYVNRDLNSRLEAQNIKVNLLKAKGKLSDSERIKHPAVTLAWLKQL